MAAARAAGELLAFGAAVVLARLVAPAEFGRAAVALAFVPLAVILTFEGCASALVQRLSLTRAHVHGAVRLSLVLGCVLTALTFVFAATLGVTIFGAPTAAFIELVSPVFVISSVGAVPRALMWRRLDFRAVSVIEVLGLLAGSLTAVALAAGGLDGAALIIGALVNQLVASVALFARCPAFPAATDRQSVRDIAGFGVPAALAGLVAVAFVNANYLIVAARVSPTQAGLYWRGYQLGISYQEKISGIMMRVAFPVYSRTSDRHALAHLHRRATRLHATTLFPLLALLIAGAPVLIPFLFGPAWEGAVLPAQILAVAGMAAAVLTGYPQVMLAIGRPKTLLHFNVGMLAVYIGVSLLAVPYGLTVVCVAVVVVYVLTVVAVYRILLRPLVGIKVRSLVHDLGPAIAGCLVLLAVCFPLEHELDTTGLPAWVVLGVLATAGGVAYLAVIRTLFHGAWSDLALFADKLVPRPRPRKRDEGAPVSVLTSGAP